jgi:hypothetical protein
VGSNGFNPGKNSNDGPVKKQVAEIKADLFSGKDYNALVLYTQEGLCWEANAAIGERRNCKYVSDNEGIYLPW